MLILGLSWSSLLLQATQHEMGQVFWQHACLVLSLGVTLSRCRNQIMNFQQKSMAEMLSSASDLLLASSTSARLQRQASCAG